MSATQELSGREYEEFAASYLSEHGYRDIEFTKASGDYGVDLLATKGGLRYAVQCKYYSSHVGISAVQQAAAGMAVYDCQRAMVITNNVFTSAAKTLAEKNGVILLEEITPHADPVKPLLFFISACYLLVAGAIFAAKYNEVGGFGSADATGELLPLGIVLLIPVWAWLSVKSLFVILRKIRKK